MVINQRIKSLLKDKDLSQSDFAETIGCSKQMISSWINGKDPVSPRYQIKILQAYKDIDPRWFLFGEKPAEKVEEEQATYAVVTKKDILLAKLETENEHLKRELDLKDEIIEMYKELKNK